MNKEVIAINQDVENQQAIKLMDMSEHEIWAKPLSNGEVVICFLNRTNTAWNLDYEKKKQTMYFVEDVNIRKNTYNIRDLWKHRIIGTTDKNLITTISPHGDLLVVLSKNTN